MPTLLRKRTKSTSAALQQPPSSLPSSVPVGQSIKQSPTPYQNQTDNSDAESTRYLLGRNSNVPSTAASETSSIYTVQTISTTDSSSIRPGEAAGEQDEEEDGARTPRASSPHPEQQQQQQPPAPQPYRGFPSQAHYLAALIAWADEKKYMHTTDTTLWGFYGTKTMEEYAAEAPPRIGSLDLGVKRRWKERKERKAKDREEGSRKIGTRRMTEGDVTGVIAGTPEWT